MIKHNNPFSHTPNETVLLLKYGEIALKGLNRKRFEDVLAKNIKWRLRDLGKTSLVRAQSTMYVTSEDPDFDYDEATFRLTHVFGLAGIAQAVRTEKDLTAIGEKIIHSLRDRLTAAKSFRITAKRADKTFPYNSPQLQQELGGILLDEFPHLAVDLHHPDLTVTVEIRDFGAYLHADQIKGAGGMPVGCSGRGMVLLSGGIDSPVAAYMMAKRGLRLHAIHFASPPYTSERALQKVEDLCELVTRYAGNIYFHYVPFTKIQEAIKKHCSEEYFTLIMRRLMMQIAIKVSHDQEAGALITGESLAQVASQTLGGIAATDQVCTLPVFRPLIGMDKEEIVRIARQIGTFETSILPYEDCCTVFTPKHPRTNPTIEQVEKAEQRFDFSALIQEAIDGITTKRIG